MSNQKRIKILNDDEINHLYGIPRFDNHDRNVIFELTDEDRYELNTLPNNVVKINYILQLGYFRANSYLL